MINVITIQHPHRDRAEVWGFDDIEDMQRQVLGWPGLLWWTQEVADMEPADREAAEDEIGPLDGVDSVVWAEIGSASYCFSRADWEATGRWYLACRALEYDMHHTDIIERRGGETDRGFAIRAYELQCNRHNPASLSAILREVY